MRWSGKTTLVLGIGLFALLMMPIYLYRIAVWPLAHRVTAFFFGW